MIIEIKYIALRIQNELRALSMAVKSIYLLFPKFPQKVHIFMPQCQSQIRLITYF